MNDPKSHISSKASGLKAMMLFLVTLIISPSKLSAQGTKQDSIQIAVLCPIYLDSAFDNQQNFRFDKNIPAYISPAMETYWGVMTAIDSMQKKGVPMSIHIIDTRSANSSVEQLVKKDLLSNMQCIVGFVTLNESSLLARYGSSKKIPVFNLNIPNDGGVTKNSYYALMNPTLATHCKNTYQFLQQTYPNSPVLYFYKKGVMEDHIRTYYQEAVQSAVNKALRLQTIFIEDSIQTEALTDLLDSTRNTVCIIGSMESAFSLTLVKQLAAIRKTFPNTIIGMPNWEQVDFTRPAYKGAEIIFSTASYIRPDNKEAQQIQKYYKDNYFARTTDLMFRSYESMLYIMNALIKKGSTPLLEYMANKQPSPWGSLRIEAVINRSHKTIDYYENKQLFMVKKIDGITKSVQ